LNFAVPVSVVNELLSGANLRPVEGAATSNYRLALDPAHPSVDRFIEASQAAISQGRDRTPREFLGLPLTLFVVLTASVGLLVVGVLVAVPVRRRHRAARRRAVPARSVQPGSIPFSFPGASRPAPLETRAAGEQRDWLDHQSFGVVGPTDPGSPIATDDGYPGGAAGRAAMPSQPWWPPEEPATEPSAPLDGGLAPRSDVAGQPPPRHRGRHERHPGRHVASSDPTWPSEPARTPVGRWDGRRWEQPSVQQAPAPLVCRSCGHQSPPAMRYCEQCWTLLGPEE
jgi:hypothetical protein